MNEISDSSRPSGPPHAQTLRDGRVVRIRDIAPSDRSAERAFIEGLSDESRRRRFLAQLKSPDDKLLDSLVNIDARRETALVAVVSDDGAERIVGAARFSMASPDAVDGECAVVVADDWQDQGLGTALVRDLAERARARGLRRIYSMDLAGNADMHELASHLGFRARVDPDDASLTIHELVL